MPVEPLPCEPGGGSTPVDVTTCCSPSIASTPLCRADGTTVVLVVRSGCVECGEAAGDPAVVGWLDVAGVFTPGALPPDVSPCEAGCVDTVCRQLCDDTDGDGTADATYSELWCIRIDGSAELVLTYQDDPSTPYLPVAPVDCTYGCPETETLQLCDDGGPFLRRYNWLDGAATYEDFALDGRTPHVVTGTVRACAAEAAADVCLDTVCRTRCDDTDADGQADTLYSELWCIRADGAAELLLTYQDDPSVPYSPIAPVDCEFGAVASEALPLCDDTGPFLRRYTWSGTSASYEDVDLDGSTPHIVTGTVGLCAGETGSPCAEQTTPTATLGLCLADGTPIAVLLTRDCAGVVTQDGWVNLTTGTHSTGAPPAGAQACGDSRAFELAGLLCDVDSGTGDVFAPVLVEYEYNPDGSLASVRLVDPGTGGTYVLQGELNVCPSAEGAPTADLDLTVLCDVQGDGAGVPFLRDYRRNPATVQITGFTDYSLDGTPYAPTGTVATCAEDSVTCTETILCDTGANDFDAVPQATVSGTLPNGLDYSVTAGPAFPTIPWWGMNFTTPQVWTFSAPAAVTWSARLPVLGACIVMPPGTVPVTIHAGHTYDPVTRTLCRPALPSTGTDTSSFSHPGTTSLTFTQAGAGAALARQIGLVAAAPLVTEFLRTVCRGADGTVVSVTDTALDAVTPYVPSGTVGICSRGESPEDCTNGTTVLLCDQPAGQSAPLTPAIADGTTADVGQTQFQNHPGPYTPLWSGASLVYPAGTGPGQQHLAAVGQITAVAPAGCEASAGTLTVAVRVTQNGLGTGQAWDGALRLFRGTTLLDADDALTYAPPGWTTTLTVSAPVTAADLTSGDMHVGLMLETFHGTAKTWTADQFVATIALDDCESSESVQFLRTVVTNCETGATVATRDTTLDGAPYAVTGDVGQCEAAGGDTPACCDTSQTLTLCDIANDGTSTTFLRRLTVADGAATPTVADFALDGVTPYEALGTVGLCPAPAEECTANTVLQVCRCDDTDGDGVADTDYAELLGVDCNGITASLGTYTADLSAPYTPVSPVDCVEAGPGAEDTVGVQARRVQLDPGGTWDITAWPTLQSVSAVAHGGTGTITTADGDSTLHAGESATWSVTKDVDALLTGPLIIAADTGTVTITFTTGVTL